MKDPSHSVLPSTDLSGRLAADDEHLAPWRTFVAVYALVSRRLDEDLRAEQDLSLAEYSALVRIAESPEQRVRMNQLADDVFLSRSGITRLIDRLEADDMVTRCQCSSDGRGAEAVLTDAGRRRLRSAGRTHRRGVKAYFLDALKATDLDLIGRELAVLTDRIRHDGPPLGAACAVTLDEAHGGGDERVVRSKARAPGEVTRA